MSHGRLRPGFESSDGSIVSRRHGLVFATHFRSGITADAMNDYANWQGTQLKPGEQIVSLSLLLGAERITDDVRDATSRYIAEYGERTRASATVIAATGFMASAARAMASTFYLVSRTGFPRKMFADLGSAHEFLRGHVDDPAELAESIAYLTTFLPADSGD